jgi:hypothetical protein
MRRTTLLVTLGLLTSGPGVFAQAVDFRRATLEPIQVTTSLETLSGRDVVRVVKSPAVTKDDEATFTRIKGVQFHNGTIEVKVLSKLLPNAPEHARGFIGVAFRINDDNSKFEAIYIRPTNGRAEAQLRRNRSVQYFSFPDFKFDRLRKEAPGEYESYADMGLNEWITLRIEVAGQKAKMFLNDSRQPVLVVNDLKHGAGAPGGIGLFVDVGTEGFFSDLKVQPAP